MATTTTERSWLDIIARADPNHARESRYVIEYEFSAPPGAPRGPHVAQTHHRGLRVFRGDYQSRGPYAPQPTSASELTWGGVGLSWGGEELTWGDD